MKPRMPNSAPEMPVTSTPFVFAPTVESLEDGDAMDCRRPTGTSAWRRSRLAAPSPTIVAARRRQRSPVFEIQFRAARAPLVERTAGNSELLAPEIDNFPDRRLRGHHHRAAKKSPIFLVYFCASARYDRYLRRPRLTPTGMLR
jgi:hypothetical protein